MPRNNSHKDEHIDYYAAKKAKLSEQFLEDHRELVDKPPQIFLGICIYINGYTVPPAEELRSIIVQHGGIYSAFLDSSVTHMIANNLPDSKLKSVKKVKVVRPEWILDSVNHRKLLNFSEYLTYNAYKDKNIWNQMKEKNWHQYSPDHVSSCSNDVVREEMSTKLLERISEESTSTDKNGPVAGADIHSFYSRSRLHFLSTMKMELRSHVANLKKERDLSFPGLENLKIWVKEKYGDQSLISSQHKIEDVTGEPSGRVSVHIDMDCFFVSVSCCGRPELEGKPVVVTSSKIANFGAFNEIKDSMADIASCSYEARAAGVRNGMRVGKALQICPKLVAVPYEFEKYRAVSYKFYEIVSSYTIDLEAVSCDELYIDCTSVLIEAQCTPWEFAEHIRKEIKEKTGCSASAGIGANRIQARLATHRAKPNGIFHLLPENVVTFMKDVQVEDLPGVGPSISRRLNELNLFNCGQLHAYGLSKLEKEFGPATGKSLYKHCQGFESNHKEDSLERKSVSSEINYGIRFTQIVEAEETLIKLSKVVSSKLGSLQGKSIALKMKIRSPDAPVVSAKYLGHGICDNFCRTVTIDHPTSDPAVISRAVIDLLRKSKISICDIRGIGVMMNKLEDISFNQKKNYIKEFFKRHEEKHRIQAEKKNIIVPKKDNVTEKIIERKTCGPHLSNIEQSYILCSLGEGDPIQLIENDFKSSIIKGKLPDKILRNRILCILLNEVALLNISFVSSFLKELDRQTTKYVHHPEIWKVWSLMIKSIRRAVLKEISKVIGHPINNI